MALLAGAGLPADGLDDQFPAAYLVAEGTGGLLGLAGLERYGADGLLRSVAVAPEARGSGLGRQLVEAALARATADRCRSVYLLTTTAAAWFPRFGFLPTPRDTLPPAVAASPEAATACPASADVLRLDLPAAR